LKFGRAGRAALWIACVLSCIAAPDAYAGVAATSTSLSMTDGSGLLASDASVPAGTVVTFVASVSAAGTALKQGQVLLCDASAALCTDIHQHGLAQLTSTGTAKFHFVPGSGNRSYRAVFVGTPNASPAYAASTSAAVKLTVSPSQSGKAITTTTMTVNKTTAGAFGLTATVNSVVSVSGLPALTGTIAFHDTTGSGTLLGDPVVGSQTSGVSFADGAGMPLTIDPTVIAEADLNGDGYPDLVVGNFNSGGVLLDVLLGKGDGSFAAASSLPTAGHYTTGIAVGDYNEDGIPDLAVANIADYNVTILFGKGDGTFTASPHVVPITAQSIVTGDFNGDGIADLATAEGYAVSVYLGKGDGTFTAAGKNEWSQVNPLYLAAGDFNGDGLTDIAASDTAVPGSVFVLLSNGDGSFRKTGLTPSTGGTVEAVTVGDFNGDGHLDLALASNGVTVLLGNGDGTFQVPQVNPYGGGRSIAVADFDGDGIADLASASYGGSSVSTLLGNGDGTFREGSQTETNGNYPDGYIAAADFNGDGVADVAIPTNADVDILLTQQTRSAAAALDDLQLTPAGLHTLVANYSGDSVYQASASQAAMVDALLAPSVAVALSQTQLSNPAEITVTVRVSGTKGYPAPTGTVTVTTLNYGPLSQVLNQGSATFQLPAYALIAGANTVTASYQPDDQAQAIYQPELGSATVTVANPGPALAPMFYPAGGTYSREQMITLLDTTPSASIYYTLDGSDPSTSSTLFTHGFVISSTTTVKAIAIASGYTSSPIATAVYQITGQASAPPPALNNLSPAFVSEGSGSFTLTVNGSGFSSGDTVLWGSTPLTTQFASSSQLSAQVPASAIAASGMSAITVQLAGQSTAASNALQFEVDSATQGSTAAPIFSNPSATVAAGAAASYPVSLPSNATNVSAKCLNLPTGAACGYASGAVTVITQPNTPAGMYTVTVVFTETQPAAAAAVAALLLLLPLTGASRKAMALPHIGRIITLGVLSLIAAAAITACGGGSGSTQTTTTPIASQQMTSSATVSLTVK
jgi:hypothetical protein